MPDAPSLESLLANEPWIRGLARGLLADENAVDDVVQQALAAALEHPPRQPGKLRAWLGAVTRNAAREQYRRRGARDRREQAAAVPEALPSAAAIAEREELRRQVVQAVLELDEPYRSTVLWRYFEELEPKAIAERTGTPAATVRTHLHRALAHLRARLDGLHGGDRRRWALGLIPLAVVGGGRDAVAASGGTAARVALGVGGLVAVVLIAGLLLWPDGASHSRNRDESPTVALGAPPRRAAAAESLAAAPVAPRAAAAPAAVQDTAPAALPPPPRGDADVPPLFADRIKDHGPLLAERGGHDGTERAAQAGLRWLRKHQRADGAWPCKAFETACGATACGGAGSTDDYTIGTTALACLAFLAGGHAPGRGKYAVTTERGLRWLVGAHAATGQVGAAVADGHWIYNHAIATAALCEAVALATNPAPWQGPAQRAVEFLLAAQNPGLGWRYGVRHGDNDTSVTAWGAMALWVADAAGVRPRTGSLADGLAGALAWVDRVSDSRFYRCGYTQKGDHGARLPEAQQFQPAEAMTAAAMVIRLAAGQAPDEPALRGGAAVVRSMPPSWDPKSGNDFYFWYFGTLAMLRVRGPDWTDWNEPLKAALVENQRRGGHQDGSWDPADAWGGAGGRMYATAINVLSLEAYYRYAVAAAPVPAIPQNSVAGRVGTPDGAVAEAVTVVAGWRNEFGEPMSRPVAVAADGTFRLDGLPVPRVTLTLTLPTPTRYVVRGEASIDVPVGSTAEFTLALTPAVVVRVVDADTGEPVPDAEADEAASSPEDGALVVYLAEPSEVWFYGKGYFSDRVLLEPPAEGRATRAEPVRLVRSHLLSGSVVGPDGEAPAQGVVVVERTDTNAPASVSSIFVGNLSTGRFQFTVARGRYRITVTAREHSPAEAIAVVSGDTDVANIAVTPAAGPPPAPDYRFSLSERASLVVSVAFNDMPVWEAFDALERGTRARIVHGSWPEAFRDNLRVNIEISSVKLADIVSLIAEATALRRDEETGQVKAPG